MQVDQKQQLRTEMKARRALVTKRERREAASAVLEPVGNFLQQVNPVHVGLYHPLQSEFDTLPLAHSLEGRSVKLSLPVVVGEAMPLLFRPWKSADPLEEGAYKIPVPRDNDLSVSPDVLLIPLLAFDKTGARLGYGGGFYDRTLEKLRTEKTVVAIGLAYDFQQVNLLPTDSHDQRLDYILTPSGLRQFPKARS